MRVVVLGANGMLGHQLVASLRDGHEVHGRRALLLRGPRRARTLRLVGPGSAKRVLKRLLSIWGKTKMLSLEVPRAHLFRDDVAAVGYTP
ncbi:MAG: hypothetical protein H0X01_04025 [Nitrospira sp.]|nr:hypothetical protein [Nitrospira sp.]